MIIVEIEMPMMGKEYDFQIDENTPLCDVKEELVEIICQKEQCPVPGEIGQLIMWDRQSRVLLEEGQTALENRLRTGSRIVLA